MLRLLVLFAFVAVSVDATCICKLEWVRNPRCREGIIINTNDDGNEWCWYSWLYERNACFDHELKAECDKAEAELTDWADGLYGKRNLLIWHMKREGLLTFEQFVTTQSAVTHAVENARHALGLHLECGEGFLTDTPNPHSYSHCYSPQLYKRCRHAQATSVRWFAAIVPSLRSMAADDPDVSPRFIDLFAVHLSDNSIDINCNVTEHHEHEIDGASALASSPFSRVLAVVTGAVLVIYG